MGSIPGNNRVYQQLATTSLTPSVYTVCFWLSNNASSGPSNFEAQWDDRNMLVMTSNSGFDYQYYSFNVWSNGTGKDVLGFQARQVPSFYLLDDVVVQLCRGCTVPI